ncbi:hypothetical protein J4233_02145 [Candidatus Pacearchaeota archaeon]|nr:hypothetical protein [Candidatus Pacearchaeota archaeon]
MVLEVLLLFSSFLLVIMLAVLLVALKKEHSPRRRFKIRDDIQRIKEQILN